MDIKTVPLEKVKSELGKEEEEELKRTKFQMPTPDALDLRRHISYEEADFIRAELHIPRKYFDRTLGVSVGTWSRMGKGYTSADLSPEIQKRALYVLSSLLRLYRGETPKEKSSEVKEGRDYSDLIEALEAIEFTLELMPESVHQRVGLMYLEEAVRGIQKLEEDG